MFVVALHVALSLYVIYRTYFSLIAFPLKWLFLFEAFCVAVILAVKQLYGLGDIPDLMFAGYTPQQLHDMFLTMGVDGRRGYYWTILFDLSPYMWGYTLLLGALFARTYAEKCLLIPLVTFLLDVIENSLVSYLLWSWKEPCCSETFTHVAFYASTATQLKWGSLVVAVVVLFILYLTKPKKATSS